MQVAEILERAAKLDITLGAEDGWITARPKGATPPELADAIRSNKGALLAHFRALLERAQAPEAPTYCEHTQTDVNRRCRCGYRIYDAERIYCPQCGQELPRLRANPEPEAARPTSAEQEERENDRLAEADGWKPVPARGHPAWSIIETCRARGVALRIDSESGDLVVGRAGAKAHEPTQPWASLVTELELHVEAVARLVEAGWHLHADFPEDTVDD